MRLSNTKQVNKPQRVTYRFLQLPIFVIHKKCAVLLELDFYQPSKIHILFLLADRLTCMCHTMT
ncbi:hypothetical protein BN1088_1431447 [Sphingobacterium sp. PM2-P1-29]|nr:hypothetical protein BN1088_1431447 [Sphingobacterium sp. PM2-P1-29]